MKIFLFILFSFSILARAENTICYDKDHFFTLEIPTGWVNDTNLAASKHQCVALYPAGQSFKEQAVLLSVNISGSKIPVEKMVLQDTAAATKVTGSEPDYTNPNGLTFILRRSKNFNQTALIARAFLKSPAKLRVILTVKEASDIPTYEGVYKEFLTTIKTVKKEEVFGILKSNAEEDAKTPTGKDFNVRFLHSVGKKLSEVLKSCKSQNQLPEIAVIRISEAGEIMDWFDKSDNKFNQCVGKKMLHTKGTKAPFGPFHVIVDLEYHLKNFSGEADSRRR
jgi:hypothetical protein